MEKNNSSKISFLDFLSELSSCGQDNKFKELNDAAFAVLDEQQARTVKLVKVGDKYCVDMMSIGEVGDIHPIDHIHASFHHLD